MAPRPRAAKAAGLLAGPLRGPGVRTLAWRAGSQPSAVEWLFWPGPDLNSVTPAPFDHAQTGIVLSGAQFGAAQGVGLVELGDSPVYATASKQAQTVTAWSATSITITANLGSLGPGTRWLFVTTNGGLTSEGRPVLVRRAAAFTTSPSPNISASGADATTARLTPPAGKSTAHFDAGRRVDDSATTPTTTTTALDYTEHEFALEATAAAVAGQTYQFRVVRSDGTVLDTYTVTPEWTISGGGGPVAGSTTAGLGVVARITGAKVASGSARPAVPLVARTTGAKIGGGTARVAVPAVARAAGSKIATGTMRTAGAPVARITGTASTVVAGSARALVAVAARITGSKVAGGAASVAASVVARPTGAKIATGSTRAAQSAVVLVSGTASGVVAGSVRAAVSVVARVSGSKVGGGSARAAVPGTVLATGSKVAAGSARVAVPVVARVTGVKISGAVLVAVPTVARVTGRKVAGAAATVLAPVVARVSGAKVAGASGRAVVTVTAAPAGVKIGRGTVRAAWAVVLRTPGPTSTEPWSWYLRRSGVWQPASAKLDGVHPTNVDVT
jgi:hypothetical protein